MRCGGLQVAHPAVKKGTAAENVSRRTAEGQDDLRSVLRRRIIWEYPLGPLLGPFSAPLRGHIAINEANQSFARVHQFISECNESLAKYLPAGLLNSAGVSMAKWSRDGEDIISHLTLRSLKRPQVTIPIRITVGTDQVKIGDELVSVSDSEKLLNSISRKVVDFFSAYETAPRP
jgi:hypothetical protein